MQAIIDGKAGPVASPEQALSQLGTLVKELPPMDAGKALYTAATAYVRAGQWGLAREAYLLLLDKYPGHPLALTPPAGWFVINRQARPADEQELGQFVEVTERVVRPEGSARPAASDPEGEDKRQASAANRDRPGDATANR